MAEDTSIHVIPNGGPEVLSVILYRSLPSTSNTTDSKTLQDSRISYDDKV